MIEMGKDKFKKLKQVKNGCILASTMQKPCEKVCLQDGPMFLEGRKRTEILSSPLTVIVLV